MSNAKFAIRAEGLGKCYRITHQGSQRERYTTLRDVLVKNSKALVQSAWNVARGRASMNGSTTEEFWALNDVCFEIQPGEVVGIIGRNGAGKSTLLKILSRITEPSKGYVTLRGRVASLLEVGTGFHPELTGRENIFLNGAILGMTQREVRRKFDEIVSFAEVEKFLDTPVKRYSSGMYVRLAFAVAAHLEPEILVVDEVLAVGDANFQKKCLGKMKDVANLGRTVLFVSHQLGVVERLTQRSLLLGSGRVIYDGPTSATIARYLSEGADLNYSWVPDGRRRSMEPQFTKVFLCYEDGSACLQPTSSEHFGVQVEFYLPERTNHLLMSLDLFSESEYHLFATSPLDSGHSLPNTPGHYKTRVMFPKALLMPKRFSVGVTLYSNSHAFHRIKPAFSFKVEEAASLANSVSNTRLGDFQIECYWSNIESTPSR